MRQNPLDLRALQVSVCALLLLTSCGTDSAQPSNSTAADPTQQAAAAGTTETTTDADPTGPIYNYIEYSENFASSGQPSASQLAEQQAAGVQRVIYVAFSDHDHSLPNEDRIAKELGLNYLQIPVDWQAPQKRDFYLFAQAMQLEPGRKTLLHCQANFRASAFAMLYRVLHLDVPLATAKADMNKIWVPNSVWTQFILDVLADQGVDSSCTACDWTPSAIGE